jgi:GTP pyrophosphokinase
MGEGIKVHRKSCRNVESLKKSEPQRIVAISWPENNGDEFAAAIKISGEDRAGLLNDITHSISTYQNTNIRGVNIDTRDKIFDGIIIISVKNTDHLNRILEKINKIKNVSHAERLLE